MLLQINKLFLLDLQELSWGTSLVITIIQICLLSSFMTLVSFSKMLPSLIFIAVSMSKNKFFIIALLWRANFSRAPIKEVTRWWGSELQRKIGSFTRFEEMETEMGICFPIQFVVSVSLKLYSCTQIDSKSNIAKFLKSVCSWVYSIAKESSLSNRVSWVWYTFFG